MADIPYEDNPNVIAYKVKQLANISSNLVAWRNKTDLKLNNQANDISDIQKGFNELKIEMRGIRKTLVAFSFSIAGASVVFALSVLGATGKI